MSEYGYYSEYDDYNEYHDNFYYDSDGLEPLDWKFRIMEWQDEVFEQYSPTEECPNYERLQCLDIGKGLEPFALKRIYLQAVAADDNGSEELRPKNLVVLGSYDLRQKSINGGSFVTVPGMPRMWRDISLPYSTPRPSPMSIKKCIKEDLHHVVSSNYPMLPTMVAADYLTPSFDWTSVDILTDRNSLKKLLNWISGRGKSDFRIDLHLAGDKSMIFERWESTRTRSDRQLLYSTEGIRLPSVNHNDNPNIHPDKDHRHYRVVAYNFGGLKIVMRFRVDACIETTNSESSLHHDGQTSAAAPNSRSVPHGHHQLRATPGVTLIKSGSLVPHESLVSLAPLHEKNISSTYKGFPHLFLSQTQNLFLGIFKDVMGFQARGAGYSGIKRVHTVTELYKLKLDHPFLDEQGRQLDDDFKTLKTILEKIKATVIAAGPEKKLSLVCTDSSQLFIFERKSKKDCLPGDWLKLFDVVKVRVQDYWQPLDYNNLKYCFDSEGGIF